MDRRCSRFIMFSAIAVLVLVAPYCDGQKDQQKLAHEKNAALTIAGIKEMLAAGKFDQAIGVATGAVKEYADTSVAGEFPLLLKKAEEGKKAQEGAADAAAARRARFAKARDAGMAAMNIKDYAGAAARFKEALAEQDDPETRDLLNRSLEMEDQRKDAAPPPVVPRPLETAGRPGLAVAEFGVSGDVGFPDAGKTVSEWLSAKFDARRYQLIDGTRLTSILNKQALTVAQVTEDPGILGEKRIRDLRYLVVGRIARMGALIVSARLIDAATGDVIQTGEAAADDPKALPGSLDELAAVLQMTNEEKSAYLDYRQKQRDDSAMADAEARVAAERERILREDDERFQQRQRERDATIALTDIKVLLARGDLLEAQKYATWASREYADTGAAREIGDLLAASEDAIRRGLEAERRELHRRFLGLCERGREEWASGNTEEAMRSFRRALEIEDDPRVREMLFQLETPGLAVLEFEVSADFRAADSGGALAGYLLERMTREGRKYRAVEHNEFAAELRRRGLALRDVLRDPTDKRLARLRSVRYLVVGRAWRGSVNLSAQLIDVLAQGRPAVVQTAEVSEEHPRDLQRALGNLARMLQMSGREKRAFIEQLRYEQLVERGDAAAKSENWKDALAAYQEAYRINPSKRSSSGMIMADKKIKALEAYDSAMAEGQAAAKGSRWQEALAAFARAAQVADTPAARAGIANARKELHAATMAEADAAAAAGDWKKARDAYQRAAGVDNTQQVQSGMLNANKHIQFEADVAKGDAAAKQGNWQMALGLYIRARAYFVTPELEARIAEAKKKLEPQPEKVPAEKTPEPEKKAPPEKPLQEEPKAAPEKPQEPEKKAADTAKSPYDQAMAEAEAAVKAGDWKKARDAYQRAAGITKTKPAQDGVVNAGKHIQFEADVAKGDAAAKEGNWQMALGLYLRARAYFVTPELEARIAEAKKKLEEAPVKKGPDEPGVERGPAAPSTTAYDPSIGAAPGASAEYADTSVAGEFSTLLEQAEQSKKTQEEASLNTNSPIVWMAANPLCGPATSIVFSPDGKILAAGFYNSSVKLYNASSGNEIRTFHDEGGGIYQQAFSPDGKTLASGNIDGVIRLWDVSTGTISKRLGNKSTYSPPFAFTPGGGLLVMVDNGVLRFMDMASGRPQKSVRCEFDGLTVLSPDGGLAAVEHDDRISLVNTATGRAICDLPGKTLSHHTISFGPDSALVAVSENKKIVLWDIAKLQAATELPGHSKDVRALAFNLDGTVLASGGVDPEIKLWNTGTGRELSRLIDGTVETGWLFTLAFSPDGQTLAAGYQRGQIVAWRAR